MTLKQLNKVIEVLILRGVDINNITLEKAIIML